MQQNQIYTFGYSNGAARDPVEHMIGEMEYLFCDLRLSPYSRWHPAWNRKSLESLWGKQYYFLGSTLGNVNYQSSHAPIQLAKPERGIHLLVEILSADHHIPVLFCACKEYETCHRKVVVELLKERIPGLLHQELGAE